MTIKIFRVNECDWYAAETGEQAMQAVRESEMYSEDELEEFARDGYPEEIPDADLDTLKLREEDGEEKYTWRQALANMIANGDYIPGMFCSTEY